MMFSLPKERSVFQRFQKAKAWINGRRDALFYAGIALSVAIDLAADGKPYFFSLSGLPLMRESVRVINWAGSNDFDKGIAAGAALAAASGVITIPSFFNPAAPAYWKLFLAVLTCTTGAYYYSRMKRNKISLRQVGKIWATELFDYPRRQKRSRKQAEETPNMA